MADSRHITRRSLIKAFPFVGATVAMPVLASEAPAALGIEVQILVDDWNRKSDAVALAWREYKDGPQGTFPHDNPRYCSWFELREEAQEAQSAVLRALRQTDLNLATLLRDA